MSETYLRADGLVELRPDPATLAQAARTGVTVITRGELCTACLVGDWGQSLLKVTKTLCDDCTWLESEVARRAGTARSRAGRPAGGGVLQVAGRTDPYDEAWAPVRAAYGVRTRRLVEVFDRAVALGVPLVDIDTGDGDGRTVRAVAREDLRRHELLDESAPVRVRRFAAWLRVLAPEDHAARADVLADVRGLAHALCAHQDEVRAARARADLERATREAVQGLTAVGRAPVALGAAAGRVVRTRLTRSGSRA